MRRKRNETECKDIHYSYTALVSFWRLAFHTFKLVMSVFESHFAERKVSDSNLHTSKQLVDQKRIMPPDAATNFPAKRSEYLGGTVFPTISSLKIIYHRCITAFCKQKANKN